MADKSAESATYPPAIFSIPQAAAILDIHAATMRKMIDRDEFPGLKLGDRIYVRTADLADLLGLSLQEVPVPVRHQVGKYPWQRGWCLCP